MDDLILLIVFDRVREYFGTPIAYAATSLTGVVLLFWL